MDVENLRKRLFVRRKHPKRSSYNCLGVLPKGSRSAQSLLAVVAEMAKDHGKSF